MKHFNDAAKMLEARMNEIECIRGLLEKSSLDESLIIKSTVMLLLYNTVEGVFTNILDTLFYHVSDNAIGLKNLNLHFQELYCDYYIRLPAQPK